MIGSQAFPLHVTTANPTRGHAAAVTLLFAIGICGCSSTGRRAARSPLADLEKRVDSGQFADKTTVTPKPHQIGTAIFLDSHGAAATGRVQLAGHEEAAAVISQAALPMRGAKPEFTPAEPREDSPFDQAKVSAARPFPDEYLFDGGDRDKPVHYDDFSRNGLDTEDTVAEYTDHTGGRHVQPTNRVAVYAPRFAAVRTVSNTEEGYSVDRAAGAFDSARGAGLKNRTVPVHHRQSRPTDGVRVRSRVSGLESQAGQTGMHQSVRASAHEKLQNLYEELTFIRSGRFLQSEEARLAYGVDAALEWSGNESTTVVATLGAAQDVYATFRPQEIIGREDERKTKGRLRIVKLADKKTAKPGDVVTFTIRYDNLGDRELHHLKVVDNLTPRLQYVQDSADSDRAGRLLVAENDEGSLVLTFEVSDPLPGHDGGVITFQARVR